MVRAGSERGPAGARPRSTVTLLFSPPHSVCAFEHGHVCDARLRATRSSEHVAFGGEKKRHWGAFGGTAWATPPPQPPQAQATFNFPVSSAREPPLAESFIYLSGCLSAPFLLGHPHAGGDARRSLGLAERSPLKDPRHGEHRGALLPSQ
ncbi:hypothetical protein SKAU_G00429520 [Synaphobranchus kaupii]|uniref:Uncharacterized protein n=1 Tax=Synaphobranchus kaupii TaxID=118154 RepID=A0A9Q1E4E5_SYNKA|nr:hypothetical protein SKAU_G00429520 [Synaphobranchus kaupii]